LFPSRDNTIALQQLLTLYRDKKATAVKYEIKNSKPNNWPSTANGVTDGGKGSESPHLAS